MNKIINILLMVTLVIPMMIAPETVSAKTLRDLKNELNSMEEEYNRNQAEKKLTEKQINNMHSSINNIVSEIDSMQKKVVELGDEIIVLNENIVSKDSEIKDIVNFIQVSNGESAYLEYAFGAKTFTDFIYRMAISEQLASYNQKLMNDYTKMIDDNNNKVKEMEEKTVQLNQKQTNLSNEMSKLGSQLSELIDVNISVEEEMKLQRDAIKLYEDMGCNLDEDIDICGRDKLPPGTAFFRPTIVGTINSEFGMRFHPTRKIWTLHAGIDLGPDRSTNYQPVYAAANGMVIALTIKSSCGGNVVYVHHNVKGKYYTTMYAHLQTINVKPQQVVNTTTVIGTMGGSPSLTPWDRCTTGQHLHFQIADGLYLKDYRSYSTFIGKSFNPKKIVNFPSYGKYTDRFIKY